MNNSSIIFDSSGLIALIKTDDTLHAEAIKIAQLIEKDSWQILLPYEVISETINILGKIIGKKDAIKIGKSLLAQYDGGTLHFLHTEAHLILDALNKLEAATGSPSYTDCLVMAHADELKTSYIFGFDATFIKNGYKLPD